VGWCFLISTAVVRVVKFHITPVNLHTELHSCTSVLVFVNNLCHGVSLKSTNDFFPVFERIETFLPKGECFVLVNSCCW
jgi:hypothetical protein